MTSEAPGIASFYGAAIHLLRWSRRWEVKRLADKAEVSQSTVLNYEQGRTVPDAEVRARIAAAFGISSADLDRLAAGLQRSMSEIRAPGSAESALLLGGATAGLADELLRTVARVVAQLVSLYIPQPPPASSEGIQGLAPILASQDAQSFQVLVETAPSLWNWAFVKLLGEESARSACSDAKRALELANLSLWVAERISGEDAWASQVFAWAFLGNARRVGSDLAGAEEAFARVARLRAEERSELPEPWRLLDLEASLRISLRQLPEALHLLDQAERIAPQAGSIRTHFWCLRSIALDRMGDPEGSIASLRAALAQIDSAAEPRLFCMLLFNLMDTLCAVGQAAAAAERLPELRRLQMHVGNGLNQIRLRWLEGKIAAGLGRTGEAIEALAWVRAAFAKENIRYDEAQAGMELAGLYLEQGRTAEVKRLVLQMEPVFRAKGVPAEARKALLLFRRAVDLETVTRELVRRILTYLRKAQGDPELRFEAAG